MKFLKIYKNLHLKKKKTVTAETPIFLKKQISNKRKKIKRKTCKQKKKKNGNPWKNEKRKKIRINLN